MNAKNPCGLGVWARYEGIVDFGRGNRRYIYRRRRWAYLWPWYWKVVLNSQVINSAIYTVKQHFKYAGRFEGIKMAFFMGREVVLGISSIWDFPVEKSMPDGVNTMYNCVRDNPGEWTVDLYTGMPIRREHYSNER